MRPATLPKAVRALVDVLLVQRFQQQRHCSLNAGRQARRSASAALPLYAVACTPWFGAGWLRSFQAHLLIENRRGERDEADRRLLHPWPDAMQHQGLKERGVHHPLMHERLHAM